MQMKSLFLADPLNTFIKDHDSTWALMQAALKLGHQVFFAEANSLCLINNAPHAKCFGFDGRHCEEQSDEAISPARHCEPRSGVAIQSTALDTYNLVFMRKDPPLDSLYLHQVQILSLCKKAKVINDPTALIKFNEKLSIFNFPELISPTIVSNDKNEIKDFLKQHGKIVLKPIDGKGGEGVFVIEDGDLNLNSTIETLSGTYNKANPSLIMAQKYIPEIKAGGDKRIILFNGKVAGALARIPSSTDHRGNLAAGGNFSKYALNSRDKEICQNLESFLIENKIYFAGIDVIGDYLTEINITSPTCLQEINRLDGLEDMSKIEFKLLESLY